MTDVTVPSPTLLKALREADWEKLLPRLAAYAEQCLRRAGWASGRDSEPDRISVMDVVNTAIERSCDGRRKWNETNPPELVAFLCGVIRSLVSDERKMFKRERTLADVEAIDAAVDSAALPGSADDDEAENDGRSAICFAVESCTKGDEMLELFHLAVLDGKTKREDIAAALGWSVDQVSAARTKLQRRLIKRFPEEFAAAKKKRRTS